MKTFESNGWKATLVALCAILALALCSKSALAMTFEVVTMNGEPAIQGHGEIVVGDAARLWAVLTPKARHSYGYFTLVLESPGGSVQAAFEISKVIDSHYVNTYVVPGKSCISACAAIVFIAGREHVAVPGSYLGFHGCFNSHTKRILTLCNEAIAEHAVSHGTSYGAVMAFIEKIPSDDVVWISGQDADCWGINRYNISPEPANYLQCVRNMAKKFLK